MIQEINWKLFKAKYNGREQQAFENFCYLLFCKEFEMELGIARFKNHAGIETSPIHRGDRMIGWQAKFYETRLSEHKLDFIRSIDLAITKHPDLNKIIFYTNQDFPQGKTSNKPRFRIEIEQFANSKGVELEWRTAAYFESPFVCEKNAVIASHFFAEEKGTINLFVFNAVDHASLVDFLASNISGDKKLVRSFISKADRSDHAVNSIDQKLALLEALRTSVLYTSNDIGLDQFDKLTGNMRLKAADDMVKYKILEAENFVKNLNFDAAHRVLGEALKKATSQSEMYKFIYREYMITGFIRYARNNDVKGLKTLLRVKRDTGAQEIDDIEYIISMIFQEAFSRDNDLKGLRNAVAVLEKMYNEAGANLKPAMANSLGLAYRRLGERTGVLFLKKAVETFSQGLTLNNNNRKIEIELKDQMAIAQIRIFETNRDVSLLRESENLLNECLALLEGPLDPRDYRIKPRVLNNLGNIYKQRTLHLHEIKSAAKAIAIYEEAEKYWNKKVAKYDWALLRKNIAETKFALGKLTRDKKILIEAIRDCIQSMRFRNLENSPYQWGKTVRIIFSIVILLDQLHSLKDVTVSIKLKIFSYCDVILGDTHQWRKNIAPLFITETRKVLNLLSS